MVTANQYDDSSIDLLLGAEWIRRRPASMLGDNGLDGARHGFTEIYGNALDEASSGFGSQLDVVYYKNGAMSIRDYGRGVPLGWNEARNNYNWHIIKYGYVNIFIYWFIYQVKRINFSFEYSLHCRIVSSN